MTDINRLRRRYLLASIGLVAATAALKWHDVRVTFDDDRAIVDAIQGLDKDDALRNAAYNWANEGRNQPKVTAIEYLGVHDFQ